MGDYAILRIASGPGNLPSHASIASSSGFVCCFLFNIPRQFKLSC